MNLPKQPWVQKLTTREVLLLIMTTLVVIGVGYYKLEYEPLAAKRENIVKHTEQVAESLHGFELALARSSPEQLVVQVQQVNDQISALREEIRVTKASMTENVEDIVRALSKQAKYHRAEMLSFNSRETEVEMNGVRYKQVMLALSIKSDYQGVGRFVQSLKEVPAVLSIQKLKIDRTRDTHPLVKTEMIIQLFVL